MKIMIGQLLLSIVALLPVLQPSFIGAFQFPARKPEHTLALRNRVNSYTMGKLLLYDTTTTNFLMGLYEDDIGWDDDLFGQIGKPNNDQPLETDNATRKEVAETVDKSDNTLDDDTLWDMGPSKSKNNIISMREEMTKSWGLIDKGDTSIEEGKPNADWVPRFGKGPDEDEPWFTG